MLIRLVEPVLNENGEIKYSLGIKNVKSYSDNGDKIYHVRLITEDSIKYILMMNILNASPCLEFLNLGDKLLIFLNNTFDEQIENELFIMTDFSDPRQLKGLILEDTNEFKDVGYLALYTNWDNIKDSGIESIFAHEYSHLWLYLLNFRPDKQLSNKFHDCTSITDNFTAFFEGLAIHFEIVSSDLSKGELFREKALEQWDNALDINSWLSYRGNQLRYFGTKNNRFVYNALVDDIEKYQNYQDLHIAHITSSLTSPYHIKSGSQMMASEGVVATFFFNLYANDLFKNQYLNKEFYQYFNIEESKVTPFLNLYLKIIFVLSKIDFINEDYPLIAFIEAYGNAYSKEKSDLYKLFLDLTYYATISYDATSLFEELYQKGCRGIIEDYKKVLLKVRNFKKDIFNKLINNEITLKDGLYPNIWIKCKDQQINPVPWLDFLEQYVFDINTATEIDFLAFSKINLELSNQIINKRREIGGFKSIDDFLAVSPTLILGIDFDLLN